LHYEARTHEGLFAEAASAFPALVESSGKTVPDRMPLLVRGVPGAWLMAAFVNEMLELVESEQFIADRLERIELGRDGLRAAVSGRSGPAHALVAWADGRETRYDATKRHWIATVALDPAPTTHSA
jgi:hypothetical protein